MSEFDNDPSTQVDDIGYLVRVTAPFVVILGAIAGTTVLLSSSVSDRRVELGVGFFGGALAAASAAIVTSSPRRGNSPRQDVAEARGVVHEVKGLAEDMTEPPVPLAKPLSLPQPQPEEWQPAPPRPMPRAMYFDDLEEEEWSDRP